MTLQTIETLVKHWVTFVKAHEKLVLIIGALLVSYWLGQRIITAWDAHDARLATIAQAKVDADATANKANADKLVALQKQVDAATKVANAAITQKHQETVQHQKVDQTLPLPDLANRWANLLALAPQEFIATPDNKVTVSDVAAHATVNELEKIPDLTLQVNKLTDNLNGCTAVRAQQDTTITGLNASLVDEHAARVADAKVAKEKERHAGLKWFKIGYVAGAASVAAVWIIHKF